MAKALTPKPRVIKDYSALTEEILEQIKLAYPYGFSENLISYTNKDGLQVSALPFEAEDKYYLVRMTVKQANKIIEDDEDYDDDGNLRDDVKEEYEEKYDEDADADEIPDEPADEDAGEREND
jgi:hypothetical protein